MRYSLSQALLFAAGVSAVAVPQSAVVPSSVTSATLSGSTGTGSVPQVNQLNAVQQGAAAGASTTSTTSTATGSTGTGLPGSQVLAAGVGDTSASNGTAVNPAINPVVNAAVASAGPSGTFTAATGASTATTGPVGSIPNLSNANVLSAANVKKPQLPKYCGDSKGSVKWTFKDGATWDADIICGPQPGSYNSYNFGPSRGGYSGNSQSNSWIETFVEVVVENFKDAPQPYGYPPVYWKNPKGGPSLYLNAYLPSGGPFTSSGPQPLNTVNLAAATNTNDTASGLTGATGATGASTSTTSVASTVPSTLPAKRQVSDTVIPQNKIQAVDKDGWTNFVSGAWNGLQQGNGNYFWADFFGTGTEVVIIVEIIIIDEEPVFHIFNNKGRFPQTGH